MWRTRLKPLITNIHGLNNAFSSDRSKYISARLPVRLDLYTRRTMSQGAALRIAASENQDAHRDDEILAEDLPIAGLDDKKVAVGWNTSTWSRYHHIWLRDHCRCPQCFHQTTKQRLLNTFEIPVDIRPSKVESKLEGLEVTWPSISSPHVSLYPWKWLKVNSYDPKPTPSSLNEKILWGSKIQATPPSITYEEAMAEDDRGLFKWLTNIERFGFSFVTGIPVSTEATEKLAERIGFIRETQYGKFWDFEADLARGDTAYTTMALGPHTDNTYFTDPCGLQLFHLLSHTDGSGGSTLLVDGFYVASLIKELHPDVYAILSSVSVPAHAAGEQSSFYTPSPPSGFPTLNHDPVTGELTQVRWNNDDRSAMNHLDPYIVENWYRAINVWNKSLTSQDSEYWVQLTPGTAVVIDNHRVLHGRSAFEGKRRMCGAYIGRDEYISKLTVLEEKFTSIPKMISEMNEPVSTEERSVWAQHL